MYTHVNTFLYCDSQETDKNGLGASFTPVKNARFYEYTLMN